MTNHHVRPASTARARIADRLFIGGSTLAYLMLVAAVGAALRLYGG